MNNETMSNETMRKELAEVLGAFGITDPIGEVTAVSGGHIHRTIAVEAGPHRLVCQAVNERIFRDLDACEENLRRIDDHLRTQAAVRVPTLRRTERGRVQHRSSTGTAWRVADFAAGTVAGTVARTANEAGRAAHAFGTYARVLYSLPGGPLRPTLPGFHALAVRVGHFEAVVAADPLGRLAEAHSSVGVARRLHAIVVPVSNEIATLPVMSVHNDAKVANLRFDARSGEARYVVDLDTTMPGSVLFDLGELLRTAAVDAPEDTVDLDSIRVHTDRAAAVIAGYAEGACAALDERSHQLLPFAGPLMTLENATRFLTDHIEGDPYYAITYEGQNLARAKAQLRVTEELLDARIMGA